MTQHIGFRVSEDFKTWLDKIVENSELKDRSQLIKKTLSEYATEIPQELDSERLEEYQKLIAIAEEDKIDKRIAQEKKKTATLHTFLASVALNMKNKGAETSDIVDVLESNLAIAERREVQEKAEKVVEYVKNSEWDYIQEWADRHDGFTQDSEFRSGV